MECSLAYQVQNREAKLLGDVFVLPLRDGSYFSGGIVHIAKFEMLFGYTAPFQCVEIYHLPFSFVP